MKRKLHSPSRRLFVKKSTDYVKPTFKERVLGTAAEVWNQIEPLGIVDKAVSKWTIKQRERFIKIINQYRSITYNGGDCGQLSQITQKVTSYLYDGEDPEMMEWLDPCYVVVDWTGTNMAPPYPVINDLDPPLSIIAAMEPSGQANTYIVASVNDGNFLLGIIVTRWPGARGFTFSLPLPIELRQSGS